MKVAVMGYGTIGSGVVEILDRNKEILAKRVGEPLELKSVLDLREFEGDPIQPYVVHDYMQIVNDPEIDIVVETMGGVEPAFTFVKAMLESGKSVCTSNKALVADKGAQLIRIAQENGANFLFEASVGGGIPIIRVMQRCLTGDVIEGITGIVNGTTNYMMTKMFDEGSEFDDVLKEAQALGYAERDPSADIEGYDACRKIAILTSIAAGMQVDYQDIPTEGITKISATDMKYAKAMGRTIKLFATSRIVGDSYACRVAPYLVASDHTLYNVNGVFNAVMLEGNMLGTGMFYGSGAGKLPTASAVVGDIVDLAKHKGKKIPLIWDEKKLELADPDEMTGRFFIRTSASEADAVSIFGEIETVDAGIEGEIGFITRTMTEKKAAKMAADIGAKQLIRLA